MRRKNLPTRNKNKHPAIKRNTSKGTHWKHINLSKFQSSCNNHEKV